MKKVCLAFNHLQYSDGIARSAIAIANAIGDSGKFDVTLRPIYKFEKEVCSLLNKNIKVKPVFRTYFKGLSHIVDAMPGKLLHNLIYGKNEFDIEIGFQFGTSTYAVGSSNNGKKHIIWMHGYDEGLIAKDCYIKADKVVCVSKCNADRLRSELNADVPIDYCYIPIDEKKVCKSGEEPVEKTCEKRPLIVSVGRLSPEKGYNRLVDIAARLKNDGYDFTIWIIGDGPERESLSTHIIELGLEDTVMLLGNQSNPHKYTSKADVFVCSSFSEGYSTACTEAAMLGVPIITTSVSGGQEIIESAGCGSLVGLDDDSLYNGIKQILDSHEIIDEWKEKLKVTKVNFSAESRIKIIMDILNEV